MTSADSTDSAVPQVVFACVRNGGRSVISRVLTEHYAAGRVRALSAGTQPGDHIHPEVATVLEKLGLDTSGEHPKLLTVASGAAYGAAKRWPSENFAAVARHWVEAGGIVAVLGSGAERKIGDEVVEGLDPRKAYNLSGGTSLIELMHLLRSSAMTVANDSGIMHLAAALGRPGVAVFGPTDFTATGPISPNWRLLYEKIECSPCFRRECREGHRRCIRAITPGMVIAEIDDLLRAERAAGARK